jgi:hypothetical protein
MFTRNSGFVGHHEELGEIWVWRDPRHNNFIALPNDLKIALAVEQNHRAGMFVNGCFMGNLFDVNVEHAAGRQVDGLSVHQIAFEENFDPVAILGDRENETGGVLNRRDQLLAFGRLRRHGSNPLIRQQGLRIANRFAGRSARQ